MNGYLQSWTEDVLNCHGEALSLLEGSGLS